MKLGRKKAQKITSEISQEVQGEMSAMESQKESQGMSQAEPQIVRMRKSRDSIKERHITQLDLADEDEDEIILQSVQEPESALQPTPELKSVSESEAVQKQQWFCSCGVLNTGKFCTDCGKPALVSESELIQELEQIPQPELDLIPTPEVESVLEQIPTSEIESAPVPESIQELESVPESVLQPIEEVVPKPISEPIQSIQVVDKLQMAIRSFNKDSGVFEEMQIKYYNDEISDVQIDGNKINFANYKIYKNGRAVFWDDLMEVVLKKGEKFEIDLGVSFVLPSGLSLTFCVDDEKVGKFGVQVDGTPDFILDGNEAIFQIVVPMVAVDELAYVQRYNNLLSATVVARV